MSLFIHPDNQSLLWQMLHKSPLLSQVFPPGSPSIGRKDDWFKRVIQAVYDSLPVQISKEDLYTINKETLRSMLKELQQKVGKVEPVYSRNGPKQEAYNDTFSTRQKEYETMFAKPVVPEVNFNENIKDEVITGETMKDLIQKQIKERELDVKQFAPPITPFLPDSGNSIIEPSPKYITTGSHTFNKKTNLQLTDEIVEIECENIQVELMEYQQNNREKEREKEKER